MARPSKSKPFAVYIPPRNSASSLPSLDDTARPHEHLVNDDEEFDTTDLDDADEEDSALDYIEETEEPADLQTNNAECDNEDDRRESAFTSTSISSFPGSSFETDQEQALPMHKPYTPPTMRPTFRRPESVRRMQMTSPISFERSPRRSVLHSQSRSGTPRSVRTSVKGSPRSCRSQYEEHVEEQKTEYPLVLLHVTLLPVELRWSMQAMEAVLPQKTLDNLQLLRCKVTETILQRGILIPHPREEYELLEERLLEALDLRKERVTKCGHFRSRESTSSASSEDSNENGSIDSHDSGVGSSVHSDEELCKTCQSRFKGARTVHGADGSKWHIRVFAANGLMRASAWAAAWSEMERVDVEILPWISEDLRRQLDAKAEEEDLNDAGDVDPTLNAPTAFASASPQILAANPPLDEQRATTGVHDSIEDFPQIYQAKDIPLSVLLKNYIYLLSKDKRNLVMFALAACAIVLSFRTVLMSSTVDLQLLPPTCHSVSASQPLNGIMNGSIPGANLNLAQSIRSAHGKMASGADMPEEHLQAITIETFAQSEKLSKSAVGHHCLEGKDLIGKCSNPKSAAQLLGGPISAVQGM